MTDSDDHAVAELIDQRDWLLVRVTELEEEVARRTAFGRVVADKAKRLTDQVDAVAAHADRLDPPQCAEHAGTLVGQVADCPACEAWWHATPATERRGRELRSVLGIPKPERVSLPPRICGLCGHVMVMERCGWASAAGKSLCHHDTHSCYSSWLRGERPT